MDTQTYIDTDTWRDTDTDKWTDIEIHGHTQRDIDTWTHRHT